MTTYQLTSNEPNTPVIRDHTVWIPAVEGNREWDEYQRWLAAGGVPEPFIPPIGPSQFDWGPKLVETIGRY